MIENKEIAIVHPVVHPVREIVVPKKIAGIYLLAGTLKFSELRFYIGESSNVLMRFLAHNFGRVKLAESRLILLKEIHPRSRPLRRKQERRFMGAAIQLGLPIMNADLPTAKDVASMRGLETEKQAIQAAMKLINPNLIYSALTHHSSPQLQ